MFKFSIIVHREETEIRAQEIIGPEKKAHTNCTALDWEGGTAIFLSPLKRLHNFDSIKSICHFHGTCNIQILRCQIKYEWNVTHTFAYQAFKSLVCKYIKVVFHHKMQRPMETNQRMDTVQHLLLNHYQACC